MKKVKDINLEKISAGYGSAINVKNVGIEEAKKLDMSGRDGEMILKNRNLFDQSYLVALQMGSTDAEARNYAVATTLAVLSVDGKD